MTHFYSEADIEAMYEAAEFALAGKVQSRKLLVIDERQPAKRNTIQNVSRAIVDAIVRGAAMQEDDDISVLPGLDIERIGNGRQTNSA